MKSIRIALVIPGTLILGTLLFAGINAPVFAQAEFPTDTIEVVTHAGAGGDTDMAARMMMLQARRELQQEMQIANKRGGNGGAAMQYFQSKIPDGHTLLTLTTGHLITMARGKTTFSVDDFQSIARGTNDPLILMVDCTNSTLKAGSDLIAVMKSRALNFGTTNTRGIDHIAAYTFASKGNLTQPKIVPFDSGTRIVEQLLAGHIDVGILNYFEAADKIKSKNICPLISLNAIRIPSLPNTKTAMELGIDTAISSVRGFVTHATVNNAIADILSMKIIKALNHPVYQAYLSAIGLDSASVADADRWNQQLWKMLKDIEPTVTALGL